jgi:hypothetical protein
MVMAALRYSSADSSSFDTPQFPPHRHIQTGNKQRHRRKSGGECGSSSSFNTAALHVHSGFSAIRRKPLLPHRRLIYSGDMHHETGKGKIFNTNTLMEQNMNTNTDFDNREKPKQAIAVALAVLMTGLIVGVFEPAINRLIPSVEAKVVATQSEPVVQRMDTIVVKAKRA